MRRIVLVAAIVSSALGQSAAFADPRPVVLELFTSEGCSSCPPADALLTSLANHRDLLPLAFHVTYWNSLGWRDPFSLQAATDRQALYAARLGGGSYTPEMVVDGRQAMVGSEDGEIAAAIAAARRGAGASVVLRVSRQNDGSLTIEVGPSKERGRVLLIGFDPRRETHVGRGENSGRVLIESNIVRSMRTVASYDGTSAKLTSPQSAGMLAAVIVQAPDGRILGAARLKP